jgi:hypothetical protein
LIIPADSSTVPVSMDDDTRLEKLINQCKSNGTLPTPLCFSLPHQPSQDVDVKVDAVTKLQAEFEGGIEVRWLNGLFFEADNVEQVHFI